MVEQVLYQSKGGRPTTVNTEKSVRARVLRKDPPGYASKVASLLTTVIAEVNSLHKLELSPLTLIDVLSQLEEGRALLKAVEVSRESRVLAQSALDMVAGAGRACKAGVVGVLATPNVEGSLPLHRLKVISGMSATHVKDSRKKVLGGDLGTFGNQSMVQNVNRDGISTTEKGATRIWMQDRNPARSGDQSKICWMIKDKEDFYFDEYRSLEGQFEIYELALRDDPSLRSRVQQPSNVWEHNLKKYTGSCLFIFLVCASPSLNVCV